MFKFTMLWSGTPLESLHVALGHCPKWCPTNIFEVSHFFEAKPHFALPLKIPIRVSFLGFQGAGCPRDGHVEVHHVMEWDTT